MSTRISFFVDYGVRSGRTAHTRQGAAWLGLAALLLAAPGCGDAAAPSDDLGIAGAGDMAVPAMGDLANLPGADLNGADLSGAGDGPVEIPQDLGGTGDFSGLPKPDLVTLPDLVPARDLVGVVQCANGMKDGNESDVDCGGGMCPGCADGKLCFKGADCLSGNCINLTCSAVMMTKVTFKMPVSYGAGFLPVRVALGDIDGNGTLDAATANQGMYGVKSNTSVLLGAGNGTLMNATNFGTGYNPNGVAAGDLNGDKRADVVIVNQGAGAMNPASLDVFLANPNGSLAAPTSTAISGLPMNVALGDLNGDGKLDVVWVAAKAPPANGAGTGYARLGDGMGGFGNTQTFTTGPSPYEVVIADLNKDGKGDALIANQGDLGGPAVGTVHIGNGDGTFQQPKTVQMGPGVKSVGAGDFNADGKLDVVFLAAPNGVPNAVTLIGDGMGGFPVSRLLQLKASDFKALAVADFNSDARLDVAIVYSSGTVSVLRGMGDGTLLDEESFVAVPNMSGGAIAAGDLDKDGKPDLVVPDLFNQKIAVLLNSTP